MPRQRGSEHSAAVASGMRAARESGVRLGRPYTPKEPAIERYLRAGWTPRRIRAVLHVGHDTVLRVKARISTQKRDKKSVDSDDTPAR